MTPFPYSLDIAAGIDAATALMSEHVIHHVPITQEGQVVGVVSDRDIEIARRNRSGSSPVGRACFSPVYVTDLDTPLVEVLTEMAERHVDVTVVTRKGKLAGIFTAIDACRGFSDYLNEEFPPEPPDVVA